MLASACSTRSAESPWLECAASCRSVRREGGVWGGLEGRCMGRCRGGVCGGVGAVCAAG